MKTVSPWRVKGIRPQARETARQAARRRGISVGEWLNAVIIDSAIGEGIAPARDLPPLSSPTHVTGTGGIGHPDREEQSQPSRRNDFESEDRRDDELHEQLAKVMNRVEMLARRFEEHQRSHLALVSSREQPSKERSSHPPMFRQQPARQRAGGEWPTSGQLSSEPANRSAGMDEPSSGASDQALHAIRKRLDVLASQAERYGRLGEVSDTGLGVIRHNPAKASPAQPTFLSPLDQATAEIAERQRALDKEAGQSRAETTRAPTRELCRNTHSLRNEGRVDKTRADSADEGLYKLREELCGLAQAGGPDSLSVLEQRIAAIDEGRPPHRRGSGSPQDLESVIARLDDEVQRLQLERTGLIAARQIQSRIEQLIDNVDASDAQLAGLEAIRWNVAELPARAGSQRETESAGATVAIDSLKPSVRSTIESRTEPASITLTTSDGSLPEGPVVPPAVKPAAAAASLRASASAALSTAAKQPEETAASRIQPAAPVQNSSGTKAAATWPTSAAQPKPQISAGEKHWGTNRGSFSTVQAPIGRRLAAPSLAADRPTDPEHHTLDMQSASPAQRIAASEASLGPARPVLSSEPGSKLDFIAAARRAAQAASAEASLGHKDSAGEADPGLARNPVTRLIKRARSLLVLAGIIMIVLASLKVGLNLFSVRQGENDPPAEATQAAPVQVAPVPTPPRSPAVASSATGPTPANGREPTLSAPQVAGSLEQRSALGSGDTPGAVSTADAVPSWLPSLPPSSSPARGERTRGGALNYGRARPTSTEPNLDVPTTTATAPSPSLGPSAPPAEESRPKLTITHPAQGEALPIGLVSNRLRAAAMNGAAAAQYEVAVRFADGRGVPQDPSAAARWFERAANQGLAPAQFRLGALYERGTGIKKDRESARRLYSAAAEAGNARAMHNLGVLYAEGIDGKPDYSNAAKWFLKAAEYGVGDSQYNLGVLYARGIGVQTDSTEAYKWFALAARAGDKEAEKKRDDIAAQLNSVSLAAARAAVAAWVAKPEPEIATTVKPPPGGWDDPAPAVSKSALNADKAAPPVR